LDGARLCNAIVAKKESAQEYGQLFDSISLCLNKGLGCPAGSLLIGNAEFIRKARRVRKVFGGGMRQAGYLAAAGIYALDHHWDRLAKDHYHADQIRQALQEKDFVGNILPVETNILIFEVAGRFTPQSFKQKLEEQGIKVMAISPTQVRMVTHLEITEDMVERTIEVISGL
ncbi:MAG TPA: beta-eliminating lyase-related protein, partial [Parasegetibacter sp.]